MPTDEEKAAKREAKRQAKRDAENEALKDMDILGLGKQELAKGGQELDDFIEGEGGERGKKDRQQQFKGVDHGGDGGGGDEDDGIIVSIIKMILMKAPKAPQPWQTTRHQEIEDYLARRDFGLYKLAGRAYWYRKIVRNKVYYWGHQDRGQGREGRGVCLWPDPPNGGGETYHGMWRAGWPHGHGIFRWFYGDMYLGEWKEGKQEGYGIYIYSKFGPHAGDRYEGSYHGNQRQGTGVYRYAGDGGGIYIGEWLRGCMSGSGIMLYPDGEHYMGGWKNDQKHGLGIYQWGENAGEVAGDKYEGYFQDGLAHGHGRTYFADGGWHKGRYAKGKMNGFGVMQTAEGFEYTGTWKDDELSGEVLVQYLYGLNAAGTKEIQIYENGEYVGERPYDNGRDWVGIESIGYGEARSGEGAGQDARKHIETVSGFVKKAKMSQRLARDAADEGKYYAKAAILYKQYSEAWGGLKKYFWAEE